MSSSFTGQVAVVTGAAAGLGFSISQRLVSEGAKVAMCDLLKAPLNKAAKQIGENARAFQLDVTDEAQVAKVVKKIAREFGRIDILVNSAGVTGKTGIKTHEVEFANFKFVFDVNVNGCFLTSRAVLPTMLQQNYGRILHIASIAGKDGNAGMLAYS